MGGELILVVDDESKSSKPCDLPVIPGRHSGRVFTRLASKEPLGGDHAAAQTGGLGAGRAGASAPPVYA
jgi:hypothetical protein